MCEWVVFLQSYVEDMGDFGFAGTGVYHNLKKQKKETQ